MVARKSFKRRAYLFFASAPLLFSRWSVRKKLYVAFLSLIGILLLNAFLIYHEIIISKKNSLKLSYLVGVNLVGVFSGALFVFLFLQGILRRLRKMTGKLEKRSFADHPLRSYGSDEIDKLASVIGSVGKEHSSKGAELKKKEDLLNLLAEKVEEAFFICDEEGHILFCTRSLRTLPGMAGRRMAVVQNIFPNFRLADFRGDGIGTAELRNEGKTIRFSIFVTSHPNSLFFAVIRPEKKSLFKSFRKRSFLPSRKG